MKVAKDLVFYNLDCKDRNECIDVISRKLIEKKYVTEEYPSKIKEREEKYPTGLKLKNGNISIMHTDTQYSLCDTIYFAKLKHPVVFKNAEDFSDLNVCLIIGLVFQNGKKHIETLRKIAELLLNEKMITDLLLCENKEQIYQKVTEYFDD